jgi:hypothetical protein
MVSTLAMADVVNKAAHREWRYTEAEFMEKLLEARAVYQKLLNPTRQ